MKTIAPWRIALTVSAIAVLAVIGYGAATAAGPSGATDATVAEPAAAQPAGAPPERVTDARERARRILPKLGRSVVHAVVTIDHPREGLITVGVDHGTIQAIGNGSIAIAEKGGTTVAVTTNADTRVRRHGAKATLADLVVGDEVYVVSRVDGGTTTARRIFAPKPATD